MFNSIRGTVTAKLLDTVLLDTAGVEWEIAIPATDLAALPPVGEAGRVFTWLSHKETEMRLFGFADETRRNTFLELLKVEGIGPKSAVKIMGSIGQIEMERALETEDLSRLQAIPGLGKKTAQKLLLTLKGKLAFENAASQASTPYAELVEALTGMGYDRRAAIDALVQAETTLKPDVTGEEKEKLLFKQAIVQLSSR
ncbi:MAG: Holliday junction branch migration protein RuvA [Treponema sp.]|jgi:Holliday junction DNA helicase RuvA|nr:Holliday junction branch migration protein RuvA [Treponema sp.]